MQPPAAVCPTDAALHDRVLHSTALVWLPLLAFILSMVVGLFRVSLIAQFGAAGFAIFHLIRFTVGLRRAAPWASLLMVSIEVFWCVRVANASQEGLDLILVDLSQALSDGFIALLSSLLGLVLGTRPAAHLSIHKKILTLSLMLACQLTTGFITFSRTRDLPFEPTLWLISVPLPFFLFFTVGLGFNVAYRKIASANRDLLNDAERGGWPALAEECMQERRPPSSVGESDNIDKCSRSDALHLSYPSPSQDPIATTSVRSASLGRASYDPADDVAIAPDCAASMATSATSAMRAADAPTHEEARAPELGAAPALGSFKKRKQQTCAKSQRKLLVRCTKCQQMLHFPALQSLTALQGRQIQCGSCGELMQMYGHTKHS